MKIKIEPAMQETEVVIKGDIYSKEVETIMRLLKNINSSDRLILYKEDEQFIVDIKEIVFLEACGNKVYATTRNEVYVCKMKLYELKEKLVSYHFAQISKSVLVNIGFVKSVQAEFSGNYSIRLKDRQDILTVSRKYFKEFRNSI